MFANIPTIKGYEKMEALPQMKYREKVNYDHPLPKDINPNKCFFESRKKKHSHAAKVIKKATEKDVLLDWYANPREIKKNIEASKQLMDKLKKPVVKQEIRQKKEYKYEPRLEMPFWFTQKKDEYHMELDNDDCLSIDDAYDPEAGIELKWFHEISRLIDFKEILISYMNKTKGTVDQEQIDNFEKLLEQCNHMKLSQVEIDKYINENIPLQWLIRRFFLKFDIPPFYDKRLNQDVEGRKNRTSIKRLKDHVHDDVCETKKYMPHIENIKYRIEAARQINVKRA